MPAPHPPPYRRRRRPTLPPTPSSAPFQARKATPAKPRPRKRAAPEAAAGVEETSLLGAPAAARCCPNRYRSCNLVTTASPPPDTLHPVARLLQAL